MDNKMASSSTLTNKCQGFFSKQEIRGPLRPEAIQEILSLEIFLKKTLSLNYVPQNFSRTNIRPKFRER